MMNFEDMTKRQIVEWLGKNNVYATTRPRKTTLVILAKEIELNNYKRDMVDVEDVEETGASVKNVMLWAITFLCGVIVNVAFLDTLTRKYSTTILTPELIALHMGMVLVTLFAGIKLVECVYDRS